MIRLQHPKYSSYHRKTIDGLIVALFHAMHTCFIDLKQGDFDLMEALTKHDAVQQALQKNKVDPKVDI